jgi:hypothetical protein
MRSSTAGRFGGAGNPIGDRVVKQRVLLCASIVAFTLAALSAGLAQPIPPPYPGTVYPGDGMILPPYEVAAIVRSTGLEPLGRPVRQGQAYAVRAIDEAGEEVRVIVDARLGRIVKVIPLMEPRYAMPLLRPPYGGPPRPVAMIPDNGIDGPAFYRPGAGGSVAGRPASAPHEPAAQAGPPLPRPRPKVASTDSPPVAPVPGAGAAQDGAKETKSNTVAPPANPAATPAEQYDYE